MSRLGRVAFILGFAMIVTIAKADDRMVYIEGTKYIVHDVESGDTLYSLSHRYNVSIEDILQSNPILSNGLKVGQTIKIKSNNASSNGKKSSKKAKKQFSTHSVVKGETLYSISRKYSISVDTILADNDNIDPAHISVGTILYIRKSEVGKTDQKKVKEQIVRQVEDMNTVTNAQDYSYHVVHSGENAENIATRFNMDVPTLLRINDMKQETDVREGLIIKVLKKIEEQAKSAYDNIKEYAKKIIGTSKSNSETLKVSMFLPLGTTSKPTTSYIDFYQGYLMGLDEVRKSGHNINISLFNTTQYKDSYQELLSTNEAIAQSDIFVGPIYENELKEIEEYAMQNSKIVVSPLATMQELSAPNIFQMSPNVETKYDKASDLFDSNRRITFITTDNTDNDFRAEVLKQIGSHPYHTHHYVYEHPSVVEKRENARANGANVGYSASELSQLLTGREPQTFVILSNSEVDVDRILSALASANISMTARSQNVAPFKVLGNNKWNRYRNIDRSLLFANNVVMFSTYHADRNNDKIAQFDREYISSFGSIPSLYSYRGYDVAIVFAKAVYCGIEKSIKEQKIIPLQTPYTLSQKDENALFVNQEWVRVNYNNDYTITIE